MTDAALLYRLRYRISPSSVFGLPDGDSVVVPTAPDGRQFFGPAFDTRTGHLVSHGTLSEYRRPDSALDFHWLRPDLEISCQDNFLVLSVSAPSAQAAYETGSRLLDVLCQSLSVQYGMRFFATFMSAENAEGTPQPVRRPKAVKMFQVTFYNTAELRERFEIAAIWASQSDERAQKALLYFEHACLVREFSETLTLSKGPHVAFSYALAFLQLFKALSTILGEPGTDADYQRRAANLGLAKDFWATRVKPLYVVRNDKDVAHYSLLVPDASEFMKQFAAATKVFHEAFSAYLAQRPT